MKFDRPIPACLLMLMTCGVCAAQQARTPVVVEEEPPTKLEAFLDRPGVVIVRGFTTVGTVVALGGTAEVTSLELIEAGTGRKVYGVSVEITETRQGEREELVYVDYDELEPLVKAIDYILKLDNTATKLARFAARYRTAGVLEVGTFHRPSGYMAAVSTGRLGRPRLFFRMSGLVEFRNLLDSARTALDAARQ